MERIVPVEKLEDGTVVYDILGSTFQVTKPIDVQLKITKQYNARFDLIMESVKQLYQKMGSLEVLATQLPEYLVFWRDQTLDEAIKLLMSYEIYDYDNRRLMEECRKVNEEYLYSVYGDFGRLASRCVDEPQCVVSDIVENYQKLKSQLLPQGDRKLFQDACAYIYNLPDTKQTVYNGYGIIYMRIMYAAHTVLQKAGVMATLDFDTSRSEAICNNCKTVDLSREQKQQLFQQAIQADPLNATAIETALILKLDDSGGLEAYAKEYGFYEGVLKEQKRALERKHKDKIDLISGCNVIPDNPMFCQLVSFCADMHADGINVDTYLGKIVDLRAAFSFQEKDISELSTFLHSVENSLGKETIDSIIQRFIAVQERQTREMNLIKPLCNKFLSSHKASLFQCSPKLKATLGITNMDDSDIYLARDDTVLKTGKNGFAITRNGIYCREMGAVATHISFEMLAHAGKITKKLTGSIYADKTIIALSTESAKDLVQLFTDIATAVRKSS